MNSVKKILIGSNAMIGKNVEFGLLSKKNEKREKLNIGESCSIRTGTIIYSGVKIGDNFNTGHNVLIRENNTIGNNVSIGSMTELGPGNIIGDNTRIHTGCFLELVILGKNIFIGPHVTFTNDPHPPTALICPDFEDCIKGAEVGDGAVIGGNSTILPHVKIGKYSLIGAGSVVTKDVPDYSVVAGNPARIIKKVTDIACFRTNKKHKPYEEYFKSKKI